MFVHDACRARLHDCRFAGYVSVDDLPDEG
jgi:hypothetical protein